ncbi:hypothetical protein L9F63_020426, partial [Diploptera punctata]
NIRIQAVTQEYCSQVIDHVTRVFLEHEPLLNTFPPCTTGAREREFRKLTEFFLKYNLSLMALDGCTVVGCFINRPITREDIFCNDLDVFKSFEDEAVSQLEFLCNLVHQKLDLFSRFNVNKMFEGGYLSVEPSYGGKGLATKLVRSGLELGAQNNFLFAKADTTSPVSAKVSMKAGMQEVYRVNYDEYKIDGNVVFKKTAKRPSHLTVVACKLQKCEPYVLPVSSSTCPSN